MSTVIFAKLQMYDNSLIIQPTNEFREVILESLVVCRLSVGLLVKACVSNSFDSF